MEKVKAVSISVVMPCFNSRKYIREAIDSVLAQTFRDFEFIIVDAGSVDGTYRILEEYAITDKRIGLLQSKKRSMGAQYNMGLGAAVGEYIAFIESDDYYVPNMLAKLHETITKQQVDYVKSNFSFFADLPGERLFVNCAALGESRANYYNRILCSAELSDFADYDKYIWHGLYRKEFLKDNNIRFSETDGAAFQDAGFVFQILSLAENAYYMKECLYKYRRYALSDHTSEKLSYRFAVNEFGFALDRLRNAEARKFDLFIPKLLRKFYVLFYDCIKQRLSGASYNEALNADCKTFISELRELYNSLDVGALSRSGLWPSRDIGLLFGDFEEYCRVVTANARNFEAAQMQAAKEFSQYKEVVIIGSGEIADCVAAYLKRNGIITRRMSSDAGVSVDKLYALVNSQAVNEKLKNELLTRGVATGNICYYGSGLNVHNWSELPTII